MDILVSGSMAYDRIMKFGGRFSDHILPDQLDNIQHQFRGGKPDGTYRRHRGQHRLFIVSARGNPRILATMGRDYHRYFEWLETCGISTDNIRIVEDELTAGAYITTDLNSNQFTGFNPEP